MNTQLIGRQIKVLRAKHQMSQSELAENCGVSQNQISRIEGGSDPKISTLDVIADVFGVPLWQLIFDADELPDET